VVVDVGSRTTLFFVGVVELDAGVGECVRSIENRMSTACCEGNLCLLYREPKHGRASDKHEA